MKTEDIEYHADGARLVGYLAVDDGKPGKRPGTQLLGGTAQVADDAAAAAGRGQRRRE